MHIALVAWLAHWAYVHLGIPGFGPWYGFWSGFGSDLGEYSIAGAMMANLYHRARACNCEVHGCWRISLHKTAAGHRVCKVHYPEDSKVTHQDVIDAHFAAKEVDNGPNRLEEVAAVQPGQRDSDNS